MTESSPSMVAKSLHSPSAGLSPVGLSPVGLSPVGLSPVGLSPDGLFGLSASGQPSSGQASQEPSSLLKANVPSSALTHFALAEPLAMKPSAHLSIQVSFLHLTNAFSTAAGASHLVHLPSSPKTAGLSLLSPSGLLPPVGLPPDGLSPDGLSPDGLSPDGLSPDGLSGFSGHPSSGQATQAPSS